MTLRRITSLAAAAATIVVLLLALAHRLGGLPEGLRGTYYPTADWTGRVRCAVIGDPQPSSRGIESAGTTPAALFSASGADRSSCCATARTRLRRRPMTVRGPNLDGQVVRGRRAVTIRR